MSANLFLDTNILVYAHDLDAGRKHERAKEVVRELWSGTPWISIQVLQEFHVALLRKQVPLLEIRQITGNYLVWKVIENDKRLFLDGQKMQERFKLSFWDALIVAAAHRAGVSEIWSEDLGHGQRFGSVRITNPLA